MEDSHFESVPELTDITLRLGVQAQHHQTTSHLNAFSDVLGAGICVFDMNADGWMDLLFVGGSGFTREYGRRSWWQHTSGNRLLLNRQGAFLEDVTEEVGLTGHFHGIGCSTADLNNDGFADLVISGYGGSIIYQNEKGHQFSRLEAPQLLSPALWTNQISFADVDNDGNLDLYLSNFVLFKKGANTFENNRGFKGSAAANLKPSLYDPQSNILYLNKGQFTFQATKLAANELGRSMGARWHDINGDKLLDLLVINDYGTANRLFLAQQDGEFTEFPEQYKSLLSSNNRDVSVISTKGGTVPSFFLSRGAGNWNSLLAVDNFSEDGYHSLLDLADRSGLSKKESLFLSNWGSVAADFNNDGLTDLYVTSGSVNPDQDAVNITQAQPNRLYINRGNGMFTEQSGEDKSVSPRSSRAVVSVDLNNDGVQEIVVSHNNDYLQIFAVTAKQKNNWLALDLSRRVEFHGAKVTLQTLHQTQSQINSSKLNFLSQNDPRLHFGIGEAERVEYLKIELLSGKVLEFRDIDINKYYSLNTGTNELEVIKFEENVPATLSVTESDDQTKTILLSVLLRRGVLSKQTLSLWSELSVKDSLHILDSFQDLRNPAVTALVYEAIRSDNVEITLSGIEILRKSEQEFSVPWLTALLSHPDSSITCASAKSFQHFWEEDEAVVYRKNLALSYMLDSYTDASSDVKACFLEAMAASEHNRPVSFLMTELQTENSDSIKARIIRTLGTLRDNVAENILLSVLRETQSADIKVATLIALKRLNYKLLDVLFREHFAVSHNVKVVEHVDELKSLLDELTSLYNNPERVVLSSVLLTNVVKDVLEEATAVNDPAIIVAVLELLSVSQLSEFKEYVRSQLTHSDGNIAKTALVAALQMDSGKVDKELEQRLLAYNLGEQISMLTQSSRVRSFSQDYLEKIANRYFNSVSHKDIFSFWVGMLTATQQQSLLAHLLLNRNTQNLISSFKLATELNIQPAKYENYAIAEEDSAALEHMFMWLVSTRQIDTDAQVLTARKLARKVLRDKVMSADRYRQLLLIIAKYDPFMFESLFDLYLENLSAIETLGLIDQIRPQRLNKAMTEFVKSAIVDNNAQSPEAFVAKMIAQHYEI